MCYQSYLFLRATHLVSKGWIKEIIEPSPDREIEDLQPSQEPIIGPVNKLNQEEVKEFTSNRRKLFQAGRLQDLRLEKVQKNIVAF